MPLDATGYVQSPRVLTEDEARDLVVLRMARHRIRHRWMWWKGDARFFTLFGTCAQLAVRERGVDDVAFMTAVERLILQLPDPPPFPRDQVEYWGSVARYNDAPTTTHADILSLFDRAIAELEE
jgi:hypothetical protein